MASDVSIANGAFRKLGHPPITSFTDNSTAGRIANERFAEIRDDLLRRHPWNFAMELASLAADGTGPAWGFSAAYTLPNDCLRVYEVNGQDETTARWKVRGRKIVTNLSAPLEIRYGKQVTDANTMDPAFREALSSECAAEWAEAITRSDTVVQQMEITARRKVAVARSSDGQEGMPDQLESDDWADARL